MIDLADIRYRRGTRIRRRKRRAGLGLGVGHADTVRAATDTMSALPVIVPTVSNRARATLSASEARRIAIAAQGLAGARPSPVGTRQINRVIRSLGALQIDTVNVFARAHYMPVFSRLGPYDTHLLDRLVLRRRGPYTEYKPHEACFLPTEDWALFDFRMQRMRAKYEAPGTWAAEHPRVMAWVRELLADGDVIRPGKLDHPWKKRGSSWWDWDDAKHACELLWLFGEAAIAGRQGFERTYAAAERVLPPEVLGSPVARTEAIRELVCRAARAYGVATAADLADYWRIRDRPAIHAAIDDLVAEGELTPVTVEGWSVGGRPAKAWLHREARIPRRVETAAILSPFDPLVWFRDRAERMFGFEYRIEIYTPAHKRRYGYYSLPVLVDAAIVGRVDLKADRAAGVLRVQSAWWEPWVEASGVHDVAARVAQQVRQAGRWQGLETVTVSRWGDASDDIAAVLGAQRH